MFSKNALLRFHLDFLPIRILVVINRITGSWIWIERKWEISKLFSWLFVCKFHVYESFSYSRRMFFFVFIWILLRFWILAVYPLFRCVLLDAKEAEDKHILLVHSKNHVKLIKNISSKQFDSRRARTASKFNSIYFNEGSSESAYLAAGSVMEVYDFYFILFYGRLDFE